MLQIFYIIWPISFVTSSCYWTVNVAGPRKGYGLQDTHAGRKWQSIRFRYSNAPVNYITYSRYIFI